MSESWKTYQLKNILKPKGYIRGPFGSSLKRNELKSSGIPVYEQQHAIENLREFRYYIDEEKFKEMSRFQVQTNDLIISCSGTIGSISLIKEEDPKGIISQALLILRVDPDIVLPEFLKYFFYTPFGANKLLQSSFGSVQTNIASRSIVETIEVNTPSINEQEKIVSILSSLDDKIDLNLKMNQTLESIAQTIFKRWFVDFQFPGSTGELENELPKGWVKGKLAEGFNITMGQSPPGESYNEEGEGIIFFQGRTDFGFRFPSTRLFTTDPKRYAEKFETLVSVRAPVGDINMAIEKCCLGRGLGSIIHKNGSTSFTYYFIKSIQDKIKQFDLDGTVFGSITKKNFENIEVIYPTEDVINEFENLIKPFDNKIYLNTLQILTLTTIRDSLLPKLITGKISVN